MTRFFHFFSITLVLIAGVCLPGCDRAATKTKLEAGSKEPQSDKKPEPAAVEDSSIAAKSLLEAFMAKYKKLKSYEDLGVLTIRLPTLDGLKVITEPMRIAYEAPNRLAIQARALQAMWSDGDGGTWQAMVGAEDFKPFGKQRMVRPLPLAIDLTWLVVDNLGAILNDPALGSPIQLQLLLHEKSLEYLLVPEAKLSMLESKEFDSVKCERVQVVLADQKWVFWIDADKLLRKCEWPSQAIVALLPGLPADFDTKSSEVSIDFTKVKTNGSIDWSVWQLPKEPDALLVRRWIDAPPPKSSPIVGERLNQFDLIGADGVRILDSAQRAKPITVMFWITNDDMGEKLVKYAFEVQSKLREKGLTKAEIFLVSQGNGKEMQAALAKWNCTLPLAIDTKNMTRDLFGIQRQPAVVIIDKDVRVQHFSDVDLRFIPEIVEELQRGVDIALRKKQLELDNEARFNSRLHRAIIDKSQTEKLDPISSFPFSNHQIKGSWKVSFENSIIAASAEHYYPQSGLAVDGSQLFTESASKHRVMTVLDDSGRVYSVDNKGNKDLIANIPTEQAVNPKRIHVLPDPWLHRWIAIVPEGLPRYWLIDSAASTESGPLDATQFDFENQDESPVAFTWAVRDGDPVLVIATNAAKLDVQTPTDKKRFSYAAESVVSIAPTINDRGETYSWNLIKANGDIEELEFLRSKTSAGTEPNGSQLKKLSIAPQPGAWEWGRNGNQSVMLGMSQLPSGETGSVLQTRFFESRLRHPLSVRPEQCRILSSATLKDGSFYWLSTGPNRVLHIQAADGMSGDQMSLGTRIFAAGLFPDGENLQTVLAVEREVNCWSVTIPRLPANIPTSEAKPEAPAKEAVSASERPSA